MKTLRLKAPEPKEADIQRQIMNRLRTRGWLVVRINGSGFKDGRGNFVRSYVIQGLNACAGFPDVVAFRRTRFLLIEVKKHDGKVSLAQERFHDFAGRFGVDVHILRDVDELRKLLID